ncbi:MAG TPA: hypothetical protein EYP53_10795 [Candidatus Latescibacteria bacterium]|nr:hypothetical protein [Candidatus Latescibacterota bacterium]
MIRRWGDRVRFVHIPPGHRIFSSFYDLRDVKWQRTSLRVPGLDYLEGIELDGRLVAVFHTFPYIRNKPYIGNAFLLNLVVFALTQPGSVAHQAVIDRDIISDR